MKNIFEQLVYGRSQTAFSENGLPIGAGLEDLGKGLRSQVGTMYSTKAKGVRYMEMAEGYVLKTALDENNEVIGAFSAAAQSPHAVATLPLIDR